jgi:nitrite reductase/ring-hydroxylating ferredoxin subunit
MSTNRSGLYRLTVRHEPQAEVELVSAAGIPVILVRREDGVHAFLDNCPDENLPLEKDDLPLERVLNRRGELVCTQHGARFNCAGCLIDPGNAHHAEQCAPGLTAIPVLSVNDASVELEISQELRDGWERIARRRSRKRHGRGPLGTLRYLIAALRANSSR